MSVTFTAYDQRVQLASPPDTGVFTIAGWVYADATTGGWRTMAAFEHSAGTAGLLFQIDNSGAIEVYRNFTPLIDFTDSPGTIPVGEWHRVAITSAGWSSTLKTYNGKNWDTAVVATGTNGASFSGTKIVTFAANLFAGGEHWNGKLYGFHVYGRELSQAELETVWRASYFAPGNPFASFPFATANTRLRDYSGNNRNLTHPGAGTPTLADFQPHGVGPGSGIILPYTPAAAPPAPTSYLDPVLLSSML